MSTKRPGTPRVPLTADAFVRVEARALGSVHTSAHHLLCSDGLTAPVEEIAKLVTRSPPSEACEALVESALHTYGSTDNTSVIIVAS